ncbi:hypothetical protein [Pantoea sp. Aalb]|uniref:hypothetical protein n=1 Tax=Pantoea sp. Aalb TaxID=2576762 RepID=UPI00351ABECB
MKYDHGVINILTAWKKLTNVLYKLKKINLKANSIEIFMIPHKTIKLNTKTTPKMVSLITMIRRMS